MEQTWHNLEHHGRRATVRDVARRAGVAPSTVSRVFGGGYASDTTRAAVFAAAQALEYRGHGSPRPRRSKTARMVGVLVSEPTNPVYAAIIHGLEQALGAEGYHLLLASSGWIPARERDGILGLAARRIDGLVLSLSDDRDPMTAVFLHSLRVPIVLVDRELPDIGFDAVLIDHRIGVTQAVRYLADLGHRRIGFLCGPTAVRPARERLAAYRDGLATHGIPYDADLVRCGSFADQFGRWAGADLLASPAPPTAIIAAGHRLGVGLLDVIRSRGARIPGDLSIIGYDDIEVFRLNDPSITVIHRDSVEMGRLAGQMLLDRLWSGGPVARKTYLPTQLVVRESCRRLP